MTPGQRHSDKKKDKMTLRKYLLLYRLRRGYIAHFRGFAVGFRGFVAPFSGFDAHFCGFAVSSHSTHQRKRPGTQARCITQKFPTGQTVVRV